MTMTIQDLRTINKASFRELDEALGYGTEHTTLAVLLAYMTHQGHKINALDDSGGVSFSKVKLSDYGFTLEAT